MFQRDNKELSANVILQVNDRVIIGTERFMRKKDEMSSAFLSKQRKAVGNTKTLFNEVELSVSSEKKIMTTRQKKILDLKTTTTQESFRSQRALV